MGTFALSPRVWPLQTGRDLQSLPAMESPYSLASEVTVRTESRAGVFFIIAACKAFLRHASV